MRVSSHNEARQGFLAAALSVPLAVFGAAVSVRSRTTALMTASRAVVRRGGTGSLTR